MKDEKKKKETEDTKEIKKEVKKEEVKTKPYRHFTKR